MSIPVIQIKDLSYTYPDGRQALKGVNLEILKGERVGIVGPNGAGKSTLILHINGVLRSENGAVKIMGKTLSDDNVRQVRRRVGIVFQDPDDQLFCPTVFDDVAFGPINMELPEGEIRHRVSASLDMVGLEGFEKRSSHHLSLGEKRRVSIATVLAMSPDILVLDEPTSNMDPGAKWSLIKLINSLQLTTMIVSHDLELVEETCSRVVLFDSGRVVAEGKTQDVLSDRGLLSRHNLSR